MTIGRVYKIISSQGNEVYVGSTFNKLRDRFRVHKRDYKDFQEGKRTNRVSVYNIFEKYSIESCKMILIKEYEVVDRSHLEAYETLWINKLQSINKVIPFCIKNLSQKQWYKNNYEKNKKHILQKHKEYYENNKDKFARYRECNSEKIKEYAKEYHQKHKDILTVRNKEYRQKNKQTLEKNIVKHMQKKGSNT